MPETTESPRMWTHRCVWPPYVFGARSHATPASVSPTKSTKPRGTEDDDGEDDDGEDDDGEDGDGEDDDGEDDNDDDECARLLVEQAASMGTQTIRLVASGLIARSLRRASSRRRSARNIAKTCKFAACQTAVVRSSVELLPVRGSSVVIHVPSKSGETA